jgi:diketogulonate reductase-like aldo/keto reductase
MLRWHLQRGRSVIPKPVKLERITENFDVPGFDLTVDELDALDALDTGMRGGRDPASITLRTLASQSPKPSFDGASCQG